MDDDRLNAELRYLRIENALLKELIRTNTSIPIDSLTEKNETGYHIHNYPGGDIPVIVHDLVNSKKKTYKISSKKQTKYKKLNGVSPEETEIQTELTKTPSPSPSPLLQPVHPPPFLLNETKLSEKDVKDAMNHIESLASIRIIKSSMDSIQKIMLYKTHDESMNKIIKDLEQALIQKGYTGKKLKSAIASVINPLSARILRVGEYFNTPLDQDYITGYVLYSSPHLHAPFKAEYHLLYNYGVCLYPMSDILEKYFANESVVYVALPKSSATDPFSFYSLSKTENGTKYWNLESRLESIADEFSHNAIEYCISLFRAMYKDCFTHNEYKEDFMNSLNMIKPDVSQLIMNIKYLHRKNFRVELCSLIVSTKTYKPTQNDKFNLTGDDPMQRSEIRDRKEPSMQSLYRSMFDNLRHDIIDL